METDPSSMKVDYVNISDTQLQLKDVWKDIIWDFGFIYTMIPIHDMEAIQSIQVLSFLNSLDSWRVLYCKLRLLVD
ncbi:hypothetical protein Lalb_Chr20g0117191 [Lupinus albus]|uniref:Uncharacterized protein n=1 Tax=Lupinus albus TaxID=3870 RepID=A0A6A4NUB2_LUPAL|nr:hypothetical protein Lalb_Chr20g0117191 [Lupinus albus]